MAIWSRPTIDFSVHGPVAVADLPGLCARLDGQLRDRGIPAVVVCDLVEVQADAVAVDALAQLCLCARRHGSQLQVQHVPDELAELVALCGLACVLGC